MVLSRIKHVMMLGAPVRYDGTLYDLTGVILRKEKKKPGFVYYAEIQDRNSPWSVLIVPLDKITEVEP